MFRFSDVCLLSCSRSFVVGFADRPEHHALSADPCRLWGLWVWRVEFYYQSCFLFCSSARSTGALESYAFLRLPVAVASCSFWGVSRCPVHICNAIRTLSWTRSDHLQNAFWQRVEHAEFVSFPDAETYFFRFVCGGVLCL